MKDQTTNFKHNTKKYQDVKNNQIEHEAHHVVPIVVTAINIQYVTMIFLNNISSGNITEILNQITESVGTQKTVNTCCDQPGCCWRNYVFAFFKHKCVCELYNYY